MPSGSAIFQTLGLWEDYATPSRDMRLMIAINIVNSFPKQIAQHPDLFVMRGSRPEQVQAEIEQYHASLSQERKIYYTRSDGSQWTLSIAEVLARKSAYEMAYNPNDCVGVQSQAQANIRLADAMPQKNNMPKWSITDFGFTNYADQRHKYLLRFHT
jgi:hypothetical protein